MARPVPSVDAAKHAASLLLKDLQSDDASTARSAAKRIAAVPPFKGTDTDDIVRDRVQRKHALDAVAREQGYVAWKYLKDAADVLWSPPGAAAFWHNWCKTYEEAKASHDSRGGYLLSAHGKCFIAERGYIEFLGLDPDDPRWDASGRDVVRPNDKRAYEELIRELADKRSTLQPT